MSTDQLVDRIENACWSTMTGWCSGYNQPFSTIFRQGTCSTPDGVPRGRYEFKAACKTHDACYAMQRGQEACDREFCSNLKNSCDWINRNGFHWASCQIGAKAFYKAVDIFGSQAYNDPYCS